MYVWTDNFFLEKLCFKKVKRCEKPDDICIMDYQVYKFIFYTNKLNINKVMVVSTSTFLYILCMLYLLGKGWGNVVDEGFLYFSQQRT